MTYRESLTTDLFVKEVAVWPWLTELRQTAYERFKTVGFPDRKNEAWKYIPLDPVLGASYVSAEDKLAKKTGQEILNKFSFSEEDSRIVFIDGVYSEELSSAVSLPHGVFLGRLSENIEFTPEIVKPFLDADIENETNAFSLVNTFSFKDGAFLFIPRDTVLDSPLHIVFATSSTGENFLSTTPRMLIVLGDRAQAEVVAHFTGFGDRQCFNNARSEVYLGEGAILNYSYIQREAKNTSGFLSNSYFLKKESSLNVLSFSQGGQLLRNENRVRFNGMHASATLKGLSMLSGESQAFHHAIVDHAVPHCSSRQFYKNILADRSKSEFNSLVHVHRDAQKSDSNQLNKNLLLSDFAESHSRPQLKIDNDDVSCTHGSATGQLQESELFYLRSRGFSEASARYVLTYGFAEEILEEVKPASLKAELESLVKQELERVLGN